MFLARQNLEQFKCMRADRMRLTRAALLARQRNFTCIEIDMDPLQSQDFAEAGAGEQEQLNSRKRLPADAPPSIFGRGEVLCFWLRFVDTPGQPNGFGFTKGASETRNLVA
jgi:hypothetical protein